MTTTDAAVELEATLSQLADVDRQIARESFEAPHGSQGIPGGLREARHHRARLAGQALELAQRAGLPRPAITAGELPEAGSVLAYLLSM